MGGAVACAAALVFAFLAPGIPSARADEGEERAPIAPLLLPVPDAPPETPELPVAPRIGVAPFGFALFGVGAALSLAGGVMLAIAPTNIERCGVAGCYGTLDRKLDFIGSLTLAGGVGIGAVGGVVALKGLASDGTPGPERRSERAMEAGIVVTALGSGFMGVAVTSNLKRDSFSEILGTWRGSTLSSVVLGGGSLLVGLTCIAGGMGLWLYGAPDAKRSSPSIRVGPMSAELSLNF